MVKPLTNVIVDTDRYLATRLARAKRALDAQFDQGMAAAGFDDIRAAHCPVMEVMSAEGLGLTELANRSQMTKQAVGELVRYLEKRGYVSVAPDPEDGRRKLVQLTEKGWAAMEAGVKVADERERRLAGEIGERRLATVAKALGEIGA